MRRANNVARRRELGYSVARIALDRVIGCTVAASRAIYIALALAVGAVAFRYGVKAAALMAAAARRAHGSLATIALATVVDVAVSAAAIAAVATALEIGECIVAAAVVPFAGKLVCEIEFADSYRRHYRPGAIAAIARWMVAQIERESAKGDG